MRLALKQDTTTGSLEVGKRADLIVVDRDIFTVGSRYHRRHKVLRPIWMDGLSTPLQRTGPRKCRDATK